MSGDKAHPGERDKDPAETRITPALSDLWIRSPRSRLLSWLAAAEGRLAGALRWIMFISLLSLALVMAGQVVMRYLLHLPFLGIEEMGPLLALWCYFAGMIYSTRHRSHIEGGILELVTRNPSVILGLRLFGTLIVLISLAVYTYYAWSVVSFNMSIGRRSVYLAIPKYVWDFAFLTGMFGMMLYLAIQAVLEIARMVSKTGRT